MRREDLLQKKCDYLNSFMFDVFMNILIHDNDDIINLYYMNTRLLELHELLTVHYKVQCSKRCYMFTKIQASPCCSLPNPKLHNTVPAVDEERCEEARARGP